MSALDAYVAERRDRRLAELGELLRIPSISTLDEHRRDVVACAEQVAAALASSGLDNVRLRETGGHPIVWGEWLRAPPPAPTLLVYGHYDVQPVDPVDAWDTPPFEPEVRDGRLYARGASDNKGPFFAYLKGLEALLAVEGTLPCNVKVLVEGEEELTAENLDRFVREHRDELAADVAVISDATLYARGVPGVPLALRGMAGIEFVVRTGEHDLHSGLYGGTVPNALHVLARTLASLHAPDGSVDVEGFYDRVTQPSEEERAVWRTLPFDVEALGTTSVGEDGFTPLERVWSRPSLDVHGVWGGFVEEGIKTVVPAEAHAKLSCRLVPDQDPEEVLTLVERHLRRHTPPGAALELVVRLAGSRPYVTPREHPAVGAALVALEEVYGRQPVLFRLGWSVPVTDILKRHLGVDSLLLGFALPDENAHAPNEHFHLENLDAGVRTVAKLLGGIAAAYG
jgi:acetylornithine deacetylase/succinyl-diaminopimelate desuccinylase-like protein